MQPVAGVLAALVPGAGHLWLGQWRRGVMIFVGVGWLFLGGILIGGVDVVDKQEDFWWFVGQAGVGPAAFGANALNQRLKQHDPPVGAGHEWLEAHGAARIRSLGHPNEIGSLWVAIAGMINVIAVIDAFWHTPRRRRTPAGGSS